MKKLHRLALMVQIIDNGPAGDFVTRFFIRLFFPVVLMDNSRD